MGSLRGPTETKESDSRMSVIMLLNEILLCKGIAKGTRAGLCVFGFKLIKSVPQCYDSFSLTGQGRFTGSSQMMSIASQRSNAMKHTKCPGVKSANNFSLYNLLGVVYYVDDYPFSSTVLVFFFSFPPKS